MARRSGLGVEKETATWERSLWRVCISHEPFLVLYASASHHTYSARALDDDLSGLDRDLDCRGIISRCVVLSCPVWRKRTALRDGEGLLCKSSALVLSRIFATVALNYRSECTTYRRCWRCCRGIDGRNSLVVDEVLQIRSSKIRSASGYRTDQWASLGAAASDSPWHLSWPSAPQHQSSSSSLSEHNLCTQLPSAPLTRASYGDMQIS